MRENDSSLPAAANQAADGPDRSTLITFGQSDPKAARVMAWVTALLALFASAVLAYYCWFEWLPRLWNWGFTPTTWRGIFSVIGGMYLFIGPAMPVAGWWQAFFPLLMSAAKPGTEEHKLRQMVRAPRSRGRVRLALVTFIAVPLLIALVALAFYLSVAESQLTLRWTFLVIVILLPAILYYLFNVSRRYSVLTDLLSNLNRFGLLAPVTDGKQETVRQRRVLGYIRKFEATYGPLSEKDLTRLIGVANIADPVETMGGVSGTNALSDVLAETRIPVLIATVLIAIGWGTALPPFELAGTVEGAATEIQAEGAMGVTSSTAPEVVDMDDSSSDKTAPQTETQGEGRDDAQLEAEPVNRAAMSELRAEETASVKAPAPSGTADTDGGGSDKAAPQSGLQAGNKDDKPPAKSDSVENAISWDRQFTPKIELIGFAFLGAYFFSIQMLFRRYIRRDLSSSAYTSVSLRIILAVIGTWIMFEGITVLEGIDPRYRLAIAFSVGLLPQIVIEALAQLGKNFFSWTRIMKGLTTSLPVTELDGLTIWHATRLEEEDVEDIYGMATVDIVNLMIRTRFHPDRIVDWVDQALLYAQLSGKNDARVKLADAGIRTATGLLVSLDKEESQIKTLFTSDKELARLKIVGQVILTKTNLQEIIRWRGL